MAKFSAQTLALLDAACSEDLGDVGDLTAGLLPEPERVVTADVVARVAGVFAGHPVAQLVCAAFTGRLGTTVEYTPIIADGGECAADETVATLSGPQAAVLTVERTLLNFLGRLAGIATLTHDFVTVARSANPHVEVLDTRKTLPGWRELDKYAVRAGGGANHRLGLYDAVLIKDNHIAGVPAEELAETVRALLRRLPAGVEPEFVEVEVDGLAQLRALLPVDEIDMILLDNFAPGDLRQAVTLRDRAVGRDRQRPLLLEASGGVTLETIGAIAATGVDRISVGAITHSAPQLDLGLDL